ncbi:hypothetical protein VIGAN_07138900, partial [Vigna angularis var. angularis]
MNQRAPLLLNHHASLKKEKLYPSAAGIKSTLYFFPSSHENVPSQKENSTSVAAGSRPCVSSLLAAAPLSTRRKLNLLDITVHPCTVCFQRKK